MPKRKRKDSTFTVLKSKKTKNHPNGIAVNRNIEDTSDMIDEDFLSGKLQTSFLAKMRLDDLSATYETTPRAVPWAVNKGAEQDFHYLLPLKESQGRLIHQQPTILTRQEASDDSDFIEEAEIPKVLSPVSGELEEEGEEEKMSGMKQEKESEQLSTVEMFVRSQELLVEKKKNIKRHVEQLMEDPEGNVDLLKQLRMLCSERRADIAVEVRTLATSAFVEVVKDIAPSYHIRELTEAEKAVKVSKDVRKLRHFEQTLVLEYRLFLTVCDETIQASLLKGQSNSRKDSKRKRERTKPIDVLDNDKRLSSSDMECLGDKCVGIFCDLLVSLPHFNFANNIIATLVGLMPIKALQGKVSSRSCEAIETLFKNDRVGQVSFEAVRHISKLVKRKGYKTKPAVLRTFLKLRLGDVDIPVSAAGTPSSKKKDSKDLTKQGKKEAKKKMSKKEKTRLISELKLEQDLQETQAVESKNKRTETQTEILKLVFLTYFRILKRSRHSPLLRPVLEGLSKFAHLINIDFFADLMSTLHSLAESGGLSSKECLLCVSTAFEILSGQGSALNIDPRQFYVQLYSALLQLDSTSHTADVALAVDCLDKMLRNIRRVPAQRALGFVKRLSTISLQLQPGAALGIMAVLKKFVQGVSQCEQVLDVESMATSGVFRPDVSDPDMSFASSTSLWELADLRLHYDPTIVLYANFLAHGAPSHGGHALPPNITRRTPGQFLEVLKS